MVKTLTKAFGLCSWTGLVALLFAIIGYFTGWAAAIYIDCKDHRWWSEYVGAFKRITDW